MCVWDALEDLGSVVDVNRDTNEHILCLAPFGRQNDGHVCERPVKQQLTRAEEEGTTMESGERRMLRQRVEKGRQLLGDTLELLLFGIHSDAEEVLRQHDLGKFLEEKINPKHEIS